MSGSTSTDVTRKRKRVKLKCLVCGRAFDDDYRTDHNTKYHPEYKSENRLVPFETLGAPKNPFEAAKRKQGKTGIIQVCDSLSLLVRSGVMQRLLHEKHVEKAKSVGSRSLFEMSIHYD